MQNHPFSIQSWPKIVMPMWVSVLEGNIYSINICWSLIRLHGSLFKKKPDCNRKCTEKVQLYFNTSGLCGPTPNTTPMRVLTFYCFQWNSVQLNLVHNISPSGHFKNFSTLTQTPNSKIKFSCIACAIKHFTMLMKWKSSGLSRANVGVSLVLHNEQCIMW